jgi:hypothetical protein
MVAADRPFIVSGWSSSYRASRNETRPMALYATQKHAEIAFYLERCSTLVAHGETGVLFGFLAYDATEYLHDLAHFGSHTFGYVLYAYTAEPFRRRGVQRALFAAAGIDPSRRFGFHCQTRSSWEIRSKIPLARHDPYRARYEETKHVRPDPAEAAAAEPAGPDPGPQDLPP